MAEPNSRRVENSVRGFSRTVGILIPLLRTNDNLQRTLPRMLGDIDTAADFMEGHAVGDQILERQIFIKHQPGGFRLKIYLGAVGTQKHALTHTDVCTRAFDTFGRRGLREQEDLCTWTRNAQGLFHQTAGAGGEDYEIGTAAGAGG